MRKSSWAIAGATATILLLALVVVTPRLLNAADVSGVAPVPAQTTAAPPQPEQQQPANGNATTPVVNPPPVPTAAPTPAPATPSAEGNVVAPPRIVLDNNDVSGILGKEIRSAADENMGRIIDVIVDRTGAARAAVIDFGGFLGVGSRKIAVDWNALHFGFKDGKSRVTLEMTKDQVKAAPEYKEGKPITVLGALDNPDAPHLSSVSSER